MSFEETDKSDFVFQRVNPRESVMNRRVLMGAIAGVALAWDDG